MTLHLGDEVQIDGATHLVCGLVCRSRVALRDVGNGVTREIIPADFARLSEVQLNDRLRSGAYSADIAAAQYLPDATRAEVLFMATHLRELLAATEGKHERGCA